MTRTALERKTFNILLFSSKSQSACILSSQVLPTCIQYISQRSYKYCIIDCKHNDLHVQIASFWFKTQKKYKFLGLFFFLWWDWKHPFLKRLKFFSRFSAFFLLYDLSSTPIFSSDYYIRFEAHLSFPCHRYMQAFPSQERAMEMFRKGKDTKK